MKSIPPEEESFKSLKMVSNPNSEKAKTKIRIRRFDRIIDWRRRRGFHPQNDFDEENIFRWLSNEGLWLPFNTKNSRNIYWDASMSEQCSKWGADHLEFAMIPAQRIWPRVNEASKSHARSPPVFATALFRYSDLTMPQLKVFSNPPNGLPRSADLLNDQKLFFVQSHRGFGCERCRFLLLCIFHLRSLFASSLHLQFSICVCYCFEDFEQCISLFDDREPFEDVYKRRDPSSVSAPRIKWRPRIDGEPMKS